MAAQRKKKWLHKRESSLHKRHIPRSLTNEELKSAQSFLLVAGAVWCSHRAGPKGLQFVLRSLEIAPRLLRVTLGERVFALYLKSHRATNILTRKPRVTDLFGQLLIDRIVTLNCAGR